MMHPRACLPVLLLLPLLLSGCTQAPPAGQGGAPPDEPSPPGPAVPPGDGRAGTEPGEPAPPEGQAPPDEPVQALSSFRTSPEIPSEAERATLPPCGLTPFSLPPVDLAQVTSITPLGSLGPPGHTFPTEHSFIHFQPGGTSTTTYPLAAPADIFITQIAQQFGITQDPEDSTIFFAVCQDVVGYFNHVKALSPALEQIVRDSGCAGKPHFGPNACMIQVLEFVPAGAALGEVGRLQGNFDFGLLDLRITHPYANPARYGGRSAHIECPYAYYPPTLREQFFGLIARNDPRQCGTSFQDVPGTLQGNWFFSETTDPIAQWEYYLAFVPDNEDPATLVVSIGGVIADPQKIAFAPQSSGAVNRAFAQVSPGSAIHCYQGEGTGKVLVRLDSPTSLAIEYREGSCGAMEAFSAPATYMR